MIPAAADPGVQPLIESALSCLQWKRPADRWAVLPDNENGDSPLVGELPKRQPPIFTASAEEAARPSGGLPAISSVDNPHLAAFCRGARSPYRQVSGAEVPEVIRQVYLSHVARYEITDQPVSAQGAPLVLRAQSPDGWAETMAAVPSPE